MIALVMAALLMQARLDSMRLERVIPLVAALDHVQGVDVEGGRAWVSSVDRTAKKGWLHVFDLATGKAIARTEVQMGGMYHPGGIALDGEFLWVPVAEYDRDGPSVIQKRGKRTLKLVSAFQVEDHIGCVASEGRFLVGGNWDATLIYRWSLDGMEQARRENTHGTRYQDLKWADGLLIGGGLRGRDEGAVDWIDIDMMRPVRSMAVGKTDRGVVFTHEGMAVRNGKLYLLPEDGPSRLFVFTLR